MQSQGDYIGQDKNVSGDEIHGDKFTDNALLAKLIGVTIAQSEKIGNIDAKLDGLVDDITALTNAIKGNGDPGLAARVEINSRLIEENSKLLSGVQKKKKRSDF